jgi:hypothetical protein
MYSNFLLGELKISNATKLKLKRAPLDMVARHAINDHGVITALERKRNQIGMQTAGQILSRYMVNPLDPEEGYVEVITEECWGTTRVKLKEET